MIVVMGEWEVDGILDCGIALLLLLAVMVGSSLHSCVSSASICASYLILQLSLSPPMFVAQPKLSTESSDLT